ncbi:AsmA family protein, partial [Klebsiella pneumoniae]|nr:AsmA family protein [Klebsiella pneumoniae]
MSRTRKTLVIITGTILLLIVLFFIVLATFDWNRLKPTINQKVSAELNRPFAIRGDLGVVWERQPDERGWRSWIPWPHVHAEDIVLGNPPAIPQVTMIHLPRVEATLAPLALLSKTVYLPWIKLEQPDVRLIRLAEDNNNWTFQLAGDKRTSDDSAPSSWSFRLDNILFDRGTIAIDDKITRSDITILVDPLGKPLPFSEVTGTKDRHSAAKPGDYVFGLSLKGRYKGQPVTGNGKIGGMLALRSASAPFPLQGDFHSGNTRVAPGDYVFGLSLKGRYKGQPVTGNGKIGGMLALRSASAPFPLQGDFHSGNTRVAFSGTVSDPLNVGGIDLRLKFAGDSLRDLYDLTGVLLPETPSFSTDGRLRADFTQKNRMRFNYQNFNGRIGDSDIHGSLTYTTGKPRPKLSGDMESKQLRLADLGPLIGVDSGKGTKKSAARQADDRPQPAGKVLPADRFETDKWQVMDADVRFKGRRIEHGGTLPISDLSTHVILEDGDLRLQPVRFGLANGSIAGSVHLQGDKKPLQGEANLQARRLKLKALMPNVEMMQKTLGEMNGDVQLRGSGNSVAALLGNSNGNLKLLMNDGLISRNLMEILGLNVGNYLIGQIFGDEEVRVNCAAANIDVTNGVARPQIFAFDTENALINVTGTASFASEQLDLTIDPESKGFRVITLRSPLYVRGTFKSPQAGVKAG